MRWLWLGLWLFALVWGAEGYLELERALASRDRAALLRLAEGGCYEGVLAARALAEDAGLSPEERARWVARVLELEGAAARLWAAGVYEALGLGDEAARLYRAELLRPEAVAGLLRLARGGSEEAARGLLAARRYEEALAYTRDPLTRGRALLALGRAEEALSYLEKSPALLGRAYLALGQLEKARRAFAEAGDLLSLGKVLLRLGRREEAVRTLLAAGARGRFEAAGVLEAEDPRRALSLYLELARGDSALADDAAFRAHVLAGRLGDEAARKEAFALVGGGLGLLLGKPLPPLRVEPLPRAPAELGRVRWLLARGRRDWALGEARCRARRARGEERRAWAWVLSALGDHHLAARYGGVRLRYATPWREAVFAEARRRRLDPWLLYAVMRVESAFDPEAVSPTGARGLYQFTASTWEEVAARLGTPDARPTDPEAAIRFGAYYLAWLRDLFEGDLRLAVMAYNGGPGYVRRGLRAYGSFEDLLRFAPRDEPREYLAKVWRDYAVYRALARVPRRPPAFLEGFPPPP